MPNPVQLAKTMHERHCQFILAGPRSSLSTPIRTTAVTMLVNLSLLATLFVPIYVTAYAEVDIWRLALPLVAAGVFMVVTPLVYRMTGSLTVAREFFILALFGFKTWECVVFGDVVSPGSIWFITLPLIGIVLDSVRSALFWLLVTTMALVAMGVGLQDGVALATSPAGHPHFLYILNLAGASIATSTFLLIVETSRRRAFHRLKIANETINELAIRDALTGVFNRRHIVSEVCRAEAGHGRFSVCLLDLDHFKSINDTYGHAVGDETLKAVATAIQREVRREDCFGRYGGEEFLLLLLDTDLDGSRQFLERIRRRIEALPVAGVSRMPRVTVSVGIAQHRQGEGYGQTINRADQALYGAKAAGRNRVMLENADA